MPGQSILACLLQSRPGTEGLPHPRAIKSEASSCSSGHREGHPVYIPKDEGWNTTNGNYFKAIKPALG